MAERSVLSQLVVGPFRKAGDAGRPAGRGPGALPQPMGTVRAPVAEPLMEAPGRGEARPGEELLARAEALAASREAESFEEQGALREGTRQEGHPPGIRPQPLARAGDVPGAGRGPVEPLGRRAVPPSGPLSSGPLAGSTAEGRGGRADSEGVSRLRAAPERADETGDAGARRAERATDAREAARPTTRMLVPVLPLRTTTRPGQDVRQSSAPAADRGPSTASFTREPFRASPVEGRVPPRGGDRPDGPGPRGGEAPRGPESRGPSRAGTPAPVRARGDEAAPAEGTRTRAASAAEDGTDALARSARVSARVAPGARRGDSEPEAPEEERPARRASVPSARDVEPEHVRRGPAGVTVPAAVVGAEAREPEGAERDEDAGAELVRQALMRERAQPRPAERTPSAPPRPSAGEGARAPRSTPQQAQSVSIQIGRVEIRVKAPSQERAAGPRAHQIQLDSRFGGAG
ncbi:hypothetical protein HPC49_34485 [Pyxidicoccus fallax]|uniref:Uncharacterized protein n=1 Tax=Pyxidicoccus fallax TaxID=394095 RepID=A0A848LW39_9BACT|nr:hypothetical protein [Pyxidicoccus fallax]NMO21851.1 hypothetical protein [Pyxidicoccus fallax]NPC83317.1 hypothetical protein [Pyxidicoccus fallax]